MQSQILGMYVVGSTLENWLGVNILLHLYLKVSDI